MIDFDVFLKKGKVQVRGKDPHLKTGLLKDAEERMEQAGTPDLKAKYRFELAYDGLREFADSLLAGDGYKTYSHEAALAYLKKRGLVDDAVLERLDNCRRKRHDSKYYGEDLPEEEYTELSLFLQEVFSNACRSLEEPEKRRL